jgi:hypothetical protein
VNNDETTINIYEVISGQLVQTLKVPSTKGKNYINFYAGNWSPGQYIVEVISANKKSTENFIKL